MSIVLSSCAAHMAMPVNLTNNSDKIPVEGFAFSAFSNKLNFGQYYVTDINRGWTKKHDLSILGDSSSNTEQKYNFSINKNDQLLWNVECISGASWNQLKIENFFGGSLSFESSSNQQLICIMQNHNKTAKLFMSQPSINSSLQGVMTNNGMQINVSGTEKFASTSITMGTPTGYIFSINNSPMGAVEVINGGNIWFNKTTSPNTRSSLATISAVMLLYQNPRKNSEQI
ncbi:hypothetical protein [Francisella adeliensis]|uniref:Uncharacterized protein n=1 Tax=Francisella adeliensis TaxID=2007306 RepID=A0A2Z4Y106_9GAMM|nr:hypothetical protein [Francisella adeliensis]AXA34629.1 hypothetical protein CDH04_09575 [Francisella adeliensis]MBK2086356.1 hypothetical protein [Francisella adeliensis]MBK2096571.1 hypothetical protein [Francisella adeliensis]QIW12874.1 hypothetical protein FZC43_09585 [Francisella adeliensis]QIW14750.1 hypothetical protein FZC44_09575 [Francisella adeliensis]